MTDVKGANPKKSPGDAVRWLISAAAVFGTLAGWALLALETRHLAAAAPGPTAKAETPFDPFPPLPTLEGPERPSAAVPDARRLRSVDRPPAPPPMAVTRSSR
jgi:hypothetical protein